MIRDVLIPEIRERFPEVGFEFLDDPQPFARLTCPCVELGELEIHDDGEEVTVVLTNITHSHYNPCRKMPDVERAQWVTTAVIDFLVALFEDRVLLYCSADRMQGGSQIHESSVDPSRSIPGMEQYDCFVWSGRVGLRNLTSSDLASN